MNKFVLFQNPSLALEVEMTGKSNNVSIGIHCLVVLAIPDEVVLDIARRHVWILRRIDVSEINKTFGIGLVRHKGLLTEMEVGVVLILQCGETIRLQGHLQRSDYGRWREVTEVVSKGSLNQSLVLLRIR